MNPLNLDVRSGLNPGSLLLKSRRARGHRVVMVPPTDRPSHFDVRSVQPPGFALVRIQQPNWPSPLIIETLFEFDKEEDANEAFRLLEEALVRDEDAAGDRGADAPYGNGEGHGNARQESVRSGRRVQARWAPLVAAVLLILLFVGGGIALSALDARRSSTAVTPASPSTPAPVSPSAGTATPIAPSGEAVAPTSPLATRVSANGASEDMASDPGVGNDEPATPGDAFVDAASGSGR